MSVICRWLQTLVSLSLWQPNIRIRIRALNPDSHIRALDPKTLSCMNGFSVPRSWHQLRYVKFLILAGIWSASTEQSHAACLSWMPKGFTPVRPSASLTRATRIRNCCECWQWSAWRSRSWLEILEGLGPAQASTVFQRKDWGELCPSPAAGQAGCSLGHSWAGKVQNHVHGNKQKGGACEPLLCCTNKNSPNLITWNISINWYESDD